MEFLYRLCINKEVFNLEKKRNMNWANVLSDDNVNSAYNNFENTFVDLYNIYFPVTLKKASRRFLPVEDWMSTGILKSRNTKLE
ncbi:MAG: hypothetical protein FJ333_11250, partial [Sphingomonadales bacterium]|nr:hypothetical protein [Sphingomonadales bacterium]